MQAPVRMTNAEKFPREKKAAENLKTCGSVRWRCDEHVVEASSCRQSTG